MVKFTGSQSCAGLGESRIVGVIEIFKRDFSFCERTGVFSFIETKIVKKYVKKSVNLRVNFDKNKSVSRIKALWEFAMKRLTDFLIRMLVLNVHQLSCKIEI